MTIRPTEAQLDAIVDIATTDRPITRLHGYAGTGKTAVVATEAIRALERLEETVQVLAPTGKAAKVLRSKGLHSAMTIHSYLYTPSKRERLTWRERWDDFELDARARQPELTPLLQEIGSAAPDTQLDEAWAALLEKIGKRGRAAAEKVHEEKRYELAFMASGAIAYYEDYGVPASRVLLIDEASMVSAAVADDLERTGSRLVFVGDPAQLPPVKAQRSMAAMGNPHHLLTEVHRQKGGSPVLKLATQIRKSTVPTMPQTRPRHLHPIETYDQILCWRNATREQANAEIRRRLGRKSATAPAAGDRLVCLKNTKRREDGGKQWMNGEQAIVLEASKPGKLSDDVHLTVRDDEGAQHEVVSPLQTFGGHRAEQAYIDRNGWTTHDPVFAFGYALTVHKAQGSEWSRVLVVDESADMIAMSEKRVGRRAALEQGRQWLYTAVTRAADEVHGVLSLRGMP